MFQSKDEADKRRNHERNLFSPTYVPLVSPDNKGTSQDKEDKEEAGGSDSRSGEDSRSRETDETVSASSFDSLVGKITTDPYLVRHRSRNLRGQTDVQVAIGTTSAIIGNRSSGNLYGLSEEQTRAYGGGLSSTRDITENKITNPERYKRIGKIREALAEKAASRLESALESLDDSKIDSCSAPKLSAIAKDMAVVMDKVTRDNTKAESVHFHLFRPELKAIGDYTTVQLSSPLVIQPVSGGEVES